MAFLDFFKQKQTTPIEIDDVWNAAFPNDIPELSQEIVISKVFDGLAYVMPNPDIVLRKLGWNKDVEAYKELLSDPQLYGAIENNRKAGVTKLKTFIDNPDAAKDEVEFINMWFEKLKNDGIFDNLLNHSLDTPLYGRMTFGVVWEQIDGKILPSKIITMPHELCKFDIKGNLMVSEDGSYFTHPSHPARFIDLRHKPTAMNPYGEALLSRCFWNVKFKRDGFRLWGLYVDRFGIPTVKAKYNPAAIAKSFNTNPNSAATILLQRLQAMARNAILVYPEGTEVDLLAPKNAATSEQFEKLIRICDEQNTKLLLGHSSATETSSGGKLGNENTATEVRDSIIQSDKKYPEALFNQLIYWIHQFNFSGDAVPKFALFAEEDNDMALATRDATLVPALTLSGLKLTKSYFMDNYGFKEEDFDVSQTVATPVAPISPKNLVNNAIFHNIDKYPDQTLIDSIADSEQMNGVPVEALIKHVSDYINSKKDYKTAIKGLAKEFPKMKTDDLQNYIEKIMFFSDIVGRLSARNEMENLNG